SFNNGFTDMALSKLNPDGSQLLWATYVGGSDADYPNSLFVSSSDELHVYGSSQSSNFPTTATAFDGSANGNSDIVVFKLSSTGSALLGSTYVGGSQADGANALTFNYGDDNRGEIVVDAAGNSYVASCTSSPTFPTTAGAYQAAPAGGQDGVLFSL